MYVLHSASSKSSWSSSHCPRLLFGGPRRLLETPFGLLSVFDFPPPFFTCLQVRNSSGVNCFRASFRESWSCSSDSPPDELLLLLLLHAYQDTTPTKCYSCTWWAASSALRLSTLPHETIAVDYARFHLCARVRSGEPFIICNMPCNAVILII